MPAYANKPIGIGIKSDKRKRWIIKQSSKQPDKHVNNQINKHTGINQEIQKHKEVKANSKENENFECL